MVDKKKSVFSKAKEKLKNIGSGFMEVFTGRELYDKYLEKLPEKIAKAKSIDVFLTGSIINYGLNDCHCCRTKNGWEIMYDEWHKLPAKIGEMFEKRALELNPELVAKRKKESAEILAKEIEFEKRQKNKLR